jgi:hypothetical protein
MRRGDAVSNAGALVTNALIATSHTHFLEAAETVQCYEHILRHVHVLNWGYHRDLLPEVSGIYWASIDDDFPNYHVFGE